MEKGVNINGAVLDKTQLKEYLEKIASDHVVIKNSSKSTFPITRLIDNYEYITKTYNILTEHLKLGITSHPAGEWLLDNYYIIEEVVKEIKKELTLKKYIRYPGIDNGKYKGYARIYILACEIVAHTDGKIMQDDLIEYLIAYQKNKMLNMEEIWGINLFIKIALIENIRTICEKIYLVQIEKYKVENILERYLENKKNDKLKFKITSEYLGIRTIDKMQYSFIEYMAYRLKKYGKKSSEYMQVLESEIEKLGLNIQEVIKREHFDIALKKVSIGNSITSIKELQRMNFQNVFTKINSAQEILNEDPAEVYSNMDFKTKEAYLNKIKEISNKTKISEIYISKKVLELSKKSYNDFLNKYANQYLNNKNNINQVNNIDLSNDNNSININISNNKDITINDSGKDNIINNIINNINLEDENYNNIISDYKKCHVGYYLIDDGYQTLLSTITNQKIKETSIKNKLMVYVVSIIVITTLIEILVVKNLLNTSNLWFTIIEILLIFIPITELVVQVIQYILTKVIKPKLIPKLDYSNGIPDTSKTIIVIPTILKDKKKVKELFEKLEVYYLANKSDNLYFALLGDCKESDKEKEEYDDEVISQGIIEVNKLNEKYMKENIAKFPLFNFIYRNRKWNSSEQKYLGWERKRGLLNEFTEYILGNISNPFRVNTLEDNKNKINSNININFKYVITLDSDTDLVLESAYSLIGAMDHILNIPRLNNEKTVVVNGYGIMQPKIGINLNRSNYNEFTNVYAGEGGVDSYILGTSDLYQDIFKEGIFTGKGIYNTKIYSKVLNKVIPENTVLSHDLLEGSYLRCGYISDIQLLDDYPTKYLADVSRIERWTRGDFQISDWIKRRVNGKSNPIDILSKFKIFDNLRRSIIPILSYIGIILTIIVGFINRFDSEIYETIYLVLVISSISPNLLSIINYIVFKKYKPKRMFEEKLPEYLLAIIKAILVIGTLPFNAYVEFKSIIKAEYRKHISKKKMLEWTTSEDAQNNIKNSILEYYKKMWFNIFSSLIVGLLILNIPNGIDVNINKLRFILLVFIWTITPYIMWHMSLDKKKENKLAYITKGDKEYILDIGKRTWKYFEDYMIEENNYFPPDNYQESRKQVVVNRTSSTNIGLGLIAIISAYDLNYISKDKCIDLIEKVINTIIRLEKWNGHLYNWYNIRTLKPLYPRYISTVDSGNFIGYLYVLKSFLIELKQNKKLEDIVIDKLDNLINNINLLINNTNFSILYDPKVELFSIGYNIEENKLTDSYYDLLASEARQASIVAIAKKDVKPKHFKNLSRTLTILNKYLGLISWSGTAFEYLMPNINIPTYKTSLLDESSKFMIYSQEKYSEKLGIPWGISESAYNLKDLNLNYQYKAFGIPWLGLKRGLADEMVVSSYGSILAISEVPNKVVRNLKRLEKEGALGLYGMYEAIDYTPERLNNNKPAVVKTYMAHHQGLIIASINNLMNNNILQKRFSMNPEIKAIDVLLQERMPKNVLITKEKKEKVTKIKYPNYSNYGERIYKRIDTNLLNTNVISNDKYTICMDDKGNSISKYNNIYINRYKSTNLYPQGIFWYVKNINTKEVWNSIYNEVQNNIESKINDKENDFDLNYDYDSDISNNYNSNYSIDFMPDRNKFTRINGDIESVTNIITAFDEPVEIRKLKLTNRGNLEQVLEVTNCFEPVLSNKMQDYSHPSFNNLFLKYSFQNDNIIIKRNKRSEKENLYLGVCMYSTSETIGELEYEIDKEKVYESGEINIPNVIRNSEPLSKEIGLVVSPIVVLRRTVRIKPMESVEFNLIIGVGNSRENVEKYLEKYKNNENVKRTFELSKARVEEENRYLGITQLDMNNYQKLLQYLIFTNYSKELYFKKIQNLDIKVYQSELWKFGISGDIPILLCIIRNIDEIYMIKEILKAYEYFKSKNIEVDIVFFNKEEMSYEQYLKHSIEAEILNRNLIYMKNIKGGIFNISRNEITGEDTKVLETRADLIIDAAKGNLTNILNDIEEEYLEYIKEKNKDKNKTINNNQLERKNINNTKFPKINPPINIEDTLYFNGYGGFSDKGKEYVIRINKNKKLKNVWSNILANPYFGVVTTQNMGGYIWNENSRLNRLTVWSNNSLIDLPSEIIYMYDKEYNKMWSLNSNINSGTEDYYITYGFGYAKYYTENLGIAEELEMFVPINNRVEVEILKLVNRTMERRKIRVVKYLRIVLGEDEIFTNKYIILNKKDELNSICAKKIYGIDLDRIMYIASSEKIKSFTGDKKEFIGKYNIKNPEGIYVDDLGESNGLGENSCIAVSFDIELNPYEQKELTFVLGEEKEEDRIKGNIVKYTNVDKAKKVLDETKQYWRGIINTLQVKTPIESMNIILNGWLIYQIIVSRLFAKSGYNQSGGAIGFRDQLQDTLGLKYVSTEFMKNQIIKQSEHQFIEGDVEHWWHEMTKMGIRTKFSDDLLWLPYVLIEYIKFTADFDILDYETNYILGDKLKENEDEKYDMHLKSDIKENIFNHALRAIDRSLNFGENGLPKIGSGDWNDGFSSVGDKGKGESVWLGFFLYYILDNIIILLDNDKMNKFLPYNGESIENLKVRYLDIKEKLKKKLNTNGWDGRWYKRAFTDEGEILGSIENEECRIDSISQSWSIISNAGDNDKKFICMENLEKYLVDKENRIIKLFDPPFEKSNLEPGYIKSYLPGVRENGGQYTHAATWNVIAQSMLNFGDKAFEYFNLINPIEHSKTEEMVAKYKVEPYVIAADVYGKSNLIGRGGWTWYTGSASWYYKAAIEYILGLKIENEYLYLNPCIPSNWKEYEIKYKYKDTMYNIKVKNPNSKNIGVEEFIFNGSKIEDKKVLLYNNKNINEIIVIM